jgi:hypothetical protein
MIDVKRRAEHAEDRTARQEPDARWVEEHWAEVTTERPCPICGARSGCSIMRGEPYARCAARPSERPMAVGGWLHQVAPRPTIDSPVYDRRSREPASRSR